MTISPARAFPSHLPREARPISPWAGRTLPQPQATSRLGHFLFRQIPKQIGADLSNRYETEATSPRPVSWRAGRQNRRLSRAESGTSPLPVHQVNDISHGNFSNSTSRKREPMENGFDKKCKRIWQSGS